MLDACFPKKIGYVFSTFYKLIFLARSLKDVRDSSTWNLPEICLKYIYNLCAIYEMVSNVFLKSFWKAFKKILGIFLLHKGWFHVEESRTFWSFRDFSEILQKYFATFLKCFTFLDETFQKCFCAVWVMYIYTYLYIFMHEKFFTGYFFLFSFK